MDKQKTYSNAPLSFIGQKRNFIKAFRKTITDNIHDNGNGWTIIDVFGGSGLLAHNAKRLLPKATVIYNDYDGYVERLNNIKHTERLRQILFEKLDQLPKGKALNKTEKQNIIEIIKNFDGYLDVQSIGSWLLFSGKQVRTQNELLAQPFYNKIRLSPIKTADDYLDGLIITKESYTTLMPKYQAAQKTLFLLDPPYLHTGQGAYNQEKYFGMIDFLYLMQLTRPPYIIFSATKSEILDYLNYLKKLNNQDWQRLGGYQTITINTSVNFQKKYQDNMIYRF